MLKKKFLGMLALAVIMAFAFSACDEVVENLDRLNTSLLVSVDGQAWITDDVSKPVYIFKDDGTVDVILKIVPGYYSIARSGKFTVRDRDLTVPSATSTYTSTFKFHFSDDLNTLTLKYNDIETEYTKQVAPILGFDVNVPAPTQLTPGQWKDDSINNTDGYKLYSLNNLTVGTTYYVWLNNNGTVNTAGDGTKTMRVSVSALDAEGANSLFPSPFQTLAWATPLTVTVSSSDMVYLYVKASDSATTNKTGTFAIAYSTTDTRPGSDVDPALNGTWVSTDGLKIVLDNGTCTQLDDDNVEVYKGTYSTSGNNITMTTTQVSGALFGDDGILAGLLGFSATQWYTQEQFRTTYIQALVNGVGGQPGISQSEAEEQVNEFVSVIFVPHTATYTLSGNTLTLTYEGSNTVYTKVVVDTALNGTWVDSDGSKVVLNNGTFTMIFGDTDFEMLKGTYSTSGNNFTLTVTHINGAIYGEQAGFSSSKKWYTREEFKSIYLTYLGTLESNEDKTQEELEAEVEESVAGTFGVNTMTYTLNGNTLTLISGSGENDTSILTRQQ